MLNKLRIFFISGCALLAASCSGPGEPKVPYGLMVEFIRQPAGVPLLDLKPEFSWIVPASLAPQKAYRVLVASSDASIRKDNCDVWDSGEVTGSGSVETECGVGLQPGTSYFWKVMIIDSEGKPSGYSAIQSFTTGYPSGYATTPNRFISHMNPPVEILKKGDGHYFIDFGKDAFGTLVLESGFKDEDTITVHLGEKIAEPGAIDRKPGGSIRYQSVMFPLNPGVKTHVLKLPPDKRNTGPAAVHLPDSFGVITPFRYCELENCPPDFNPKKVVQKAYTIYFDDDASSFSSSDSVLNQVWDLCKYSIKATSFTGIYVDGDRERIPYEADAYINQLGHYYTDREYSMGRVSNEYFIGHPTWPTEWILHTVLMFYNDLMFTGNTESVAEYYDELKHKTLIALAREDGLISSAAVNEEVMKSIGFSNPKERIRDIVDWPPAQKDTGWKLVTAEGERDGYELVEINTVVNAFYYRNLVLMSEIAAMLGKTEDASFYSNEAVRVKDTFNNILLEKERGYYVDGENSLHSSLHANMMALAFGLVPEEFRDIVVEFIKSRGMACSVYGSQYLLEGLYRAGEAEYALSLMTATHDRSWWNMIRSGSTIAMEAWDMKYKPNSDWNHAWGAAPANIIPGYMWGIQPAKPGFAKCIIRPQLNGLNYSTIEVPTIRGSIKAEYRENGTEKLFLITLPGNMECEFEIPGKDVFKLNPGLNKITL
ncbi:MAG: alpha-L-rhamnosidase [Bacteroidales bacterium]|nr:alpha-L-rhamnosidase [Bacteroidales bacterium]MBN2634567.1 alpha-L-rhamnosidase [Bacteroidales bacterium]